MFPTGSKIPGAFRGRPKSRRSRPGSNQRFSQTGFNASAVVLGLRLQPYGHPLIDKILVDILGGSKLRK